MGGTGKRRICLLGKMSHMVAAGKGKPCLGMFVPRLMDIMSNNTQMKSPKMNVEMQNIRMIGPKLRIGIRVTNTKIIGIKKRKDIVEMIGIKKRKGIVEMIGIKKRKDIVEMKGTERKGLDMKIDIGMQNTKRKDLKRRADIRMKDTKRSLEMKRSLGMKDLTIALERNIEMIFIEIVGIKMVDHGECDPQRITLETDLWKSTTRTNLITQIADIIKIDLMTMKRMHLLLITGAPSMEMIAK
jgi:hypothetical protein